MANDMDDDLPPNPAPVKRDKTAVARQSGDVNDVRNATNAAYKDFLGWDRNVSGLPMGDATRADTAGTLTSGFYKHFFGDVPAYQKARKLYDTLQEAQKRRIRD